MSPNQELDEIRKEWSFLTLAEEFSGVTPELHVAQLNCLNRIETLLGETILQAHRSGMPIDQIAHAVQRGKDRARERRADVQKD